MSVQDQHDLNSLPDDWWQEEGHCKGFAKNLFSQHIIGLYAQVREKNEIRKVIYSGVLIENNGILLWLTAGHVIDELREAESKSEITLESLQWVDTFEEIGPAGIISVGKNRQMYSFTDKHTDIGIIKIFGLEAMNIRSNENIRPIDGESLSNFRQIHPEGYHLVGFPNELAGDNGGAFEASFLCLPVQKTEYNDNWRTYESRSDGSWNDPQDFYGQILSFAENLNGQPDSIKGMSGGPIFAIERNKLHVNKLFHRLIGIQSRWVPTTRTIRAEPIDQILPLLAGIDP